MLIRMQNLLKSDDHLIRSTRGGWLESGYLVQNNLLIRDFSRGDETTQPRGVTPSEF